MLVPILHALYLSLFETAFLTLHDCKIKDRFVVSSKPEREAGGVGVYVRQRCFSV